VLMATKLVAASPEKTKPPNPVFPMAIDSLPPGTASWGFNPVSWGSTRLHALQCGNCRGSSGRLPLCSPDDQAQRGGCPQSSPGPRRLHSG
jgi:hypothetical protein